MIHTRHADLDADIVIVGNGIIGASCATLLANMDLRIVLIDTTPPRHRQSPDPRVLAITPASRQILLTAGIWGHIEEKQRGYFRKIRIWDETDSGQIQFDCRAICQPVMGYTIAYRFIQAALAKAVDRNRNIQLIQAVTPTAIQIEKEHALLALSNKEWIRGKLLIAADGIYSTLRQLAGIDYRQSLYNQHALSCLVKTEHPHQHVARQRFLDSGPLAFLPLAGAHDCAVIWSTSPGHADRLRELDTASFNTILAESFGHDAGAIQTCGQRVCLPLSQAQARHYCLPRLALIGDAAHCLHPLAGQGSNLGLLDAASLAEVLYTAKQRRQDMGELRVLKRYARWRYAQNHLMIRALDGLKRVFAHQAKWMVQGRNIGLRTLDRLPILKNQIMKNAMGLTGDLPRMVKKTKPTG